MIRVVDAMELCSPTLKDRVQPSRDGCRRPGEDCDFPVRGEGENTGDDGAAEERGGAACYCYCGHGRMVQDLSICTCDLWRMDENRKCLNLHKCCTVICITNGTACDLKWPLQSGYAGG